MSQSHNSMRFDRIAVFLILTKHKLMTSVSTQRKTVHVHVCENDREQLLYTSYLFPFKAVVAESSSATGKFCWRHVSSWAPRFLATFLLMTRPILVGLQVVDKVSISDHRHLQQEQVSVPEKL